MISGMNLFAITEQRTGLHLLVFFAVLAGLIALWAFLIRRFWPPRSH